MSDREATRIEDMSARGRLRLLQQADGDIIVAVQSEENGLLQRGDSVEFCTAGAGGGRSPHTLAALRALMAAIEKDNAERPIQDEGYQSPPATAECADLPAFMRRDIERAIEEAAHPKGMSVHDGKARIGGDRLQRLLLIADQAHAEIAAARQEILAKSRGCDKVGSVEAVGRDLDGMPQPYAGAITLLETIAEFGARAYIGEAPTPMREDCMRIAQELRSAGAMQKAAAPIKQEGASK